MATHFSKELVVKPGERVRLEKYDADETLGWEKDHKMKSSLDKTLEKLDSLQYLLYAEKKRSLLIVLQALDAGGKDGTIRHVMSGVSPQGCKVTSFKVPSPEEAMHDFLWRIHKAVPEYGYLGIFNRSHYEDVLVARVHNLVPREVWSRRYEEINQFEKFLTDNGTIILKFFLHISKQEQKKRLEGRTHDPSKEWKLSPADFQERKYWSEYQQAYQDVLTKCSTKRCPWFIIPANHKWFRNLAVSHIILRTLQSLRMKYPIPIGEAAKPKAQ
jgi:PPK2 family polyphosphate:nucleotide phosphotransferase